MRILMHVDVLQQGLVRIWIIREFLNTWATRIIQNSSKNILKVSQKLNIQTIIVKCVYFVFVLSLKQSSFIILHFLRRRIFLWV